MPRLILLVSLVIFWRLIKRDNRLREGISSALWIPTLWVGIIASRPLSTWLGFGGASDTLEGSPADRAFFFVMIFAAMIVVSRRGVNWGRLISENWAVFLFYGFLLVSVTWAHSPGASFKRWFKEVGNIFVLLVILTEADPEQALRAIFFRCGCILLPLSVVFIRWFPDLGRRYNIHSGEMEATGVTFQKNSLGALIVVTCFLIVWDVLVLLNRRKREPDEKLKFDLAVRVVLLATGVYLLRLCNSQTSMVCLLMGTAILLAARLPIFQARLRFLGWAAAIVFFGFFALDQMFDIKRAIIHELGRNMTLTGRTDVWDVLRHAGTDPLIGTGYMSFWDDENFRSKLPDWVAFSAHNGYLEMYLCGGAVCLFFLAIMLLATGVKLNKALAWDGDYGVIRFATFLMAVVANYTETNFAWMTPIGFLFLTAAIGHAEAAFAPQLAETNAAAENNQEVRVESEPAASSF
jgi:hypothetical protein